MGAVGPRSKPIAFLGSSLMMGLTPGNVLGPMTSRCWLIGRAMPFVGRWRPRPASLPWDILAVWGMSPCRWRGFWPPRTSRRMPPCLMGPRWVGLSRPARMAPRLTSPCPMGPEAEGDRRLRHRLLRARRIRSGLRGRSGRSRVTVDPKSVGRTVGSRPSSRRSAIRKATCRDCGYPLQGDEIA